MAGLSDYAADKVLNHLFRTATFTKLGNVYVALNDYDPTDAGLTASEITGSAYARVAVPVADASWTAPAAAGGVRQITNNIIITFPDPTGDWNGGNPVDYASIWDAITGGNMLASGILTTPRVILGIDSNPQFGFGALVFTLA
jgi:hypothetical protein